MKLFGSPRRPFARKVRIVPAEKNIPFELVVARDSTPNASPNARPRSLSISRGWNATSGRRPGAKGNKNHSIQ